MRGEDYRLRIRLSQTFVDQSLADAKIVGNDCIGLTKLMALLLLAA
jgi:hypothetical protein